MLTPTQIIETIRRDPKVPAPSQTVFKVLELTKDPDCDVEEVAAVIARDSGLTSQVLRQANSALYGFKSPTSSVAAACVRLGFKRVRAAVINEHIVSGLGKALPPGFDAHQYWQATFATSVAAHDLCRRLLPDMAEDAGTAGLLCDIGVGLLAFGIPGAYRHVLREASRPPAAGLHEIEERRLGLTHAEVGAAVLADWRLDEHITGAVRLHHADPLAQNSPRMDRFARIISAAAALSRIALRGSDMDSVAVLFAQVDAVTPDADALVTGLLDRLVSHIQDTAVSLSVELGPMDQVQANFDAFMRELPDVGKRLSFRPMPIESAGA